MCVPLPEGSPQCAPHRSETGRVHCTGCPPARRGSAAPASPGHPLHSAVGCDARRRCGATNIVSVGRRTPSTLRFLLLSSSNSPPARVRACHTCLLAARFSPRCTHNTASDDPLLGDSLKVAEAGLLRLHLIDLHALALGRRGRGGAGGAGGRRRPGVRLDVH